MEIRQYETGDFPQVISLVKAGGLFDSVWDTEESLNSLNGLVVLEDKKIIGCLFIIPYSKKVAFIFRLTVDNEHRNKGIATELLKAAEKLVQIRNNDEVGLWVDSDDLDLQNFYQKRGFKRSKKAYFYMFKGLK